MIGDRGTAAPGPEFAREAEGGVARAVRRQVLPRAAGRLEFTLTKIDSGTTREQPSSRSHVSRRAASERHAIAVTIWWSVASYLVKTPEPQKETAMSESTLPATGSE